MPYCLGNTKHAKVSLPLCSLTQAVVEAKLFWCRNIVRVHSPLCLWYHTLCVNNNSQSIQKYFPEWQGFSRSSPDAYLDCLLCLLELENFSQPCFVANAQYTRTSAQNAPHPSLNAQSSSRCFLSSAVFCSLRVAVCRAVVQSVERRGWLSLANGQRHCGLCRRNRRDSEHTGRIQSALRATVCDRECVIAVALAE